MKRSLFSAAFVALCAVVVCGTPAFAQDRAQFRDQARHNAEQLRSAGEPMDRCSLGGIIQERTVVDVFGVTSLLVGDQVLNVNGVDVSSSNDDQIIALLRGLSPTAQVPVIVRRGAENANLQVSCTNARTYMQPLLAALDFIGRGRFDDCVQTLNGTESGDAETMALKLQCALFTSHPERLGTGELTYQIALKLVQAARVLPTRRTIVIQQLRAWDAAFRELVDATRHWPGGEDAWDRSEPDWRLFRRNAEIALKRGLIDPDSARIEWPHGFLFGSWGPLFQPRVEGYWTCGLINARNRMGGYVGATAFVVVVGPEGEVRYSEVGSGRDVDLLTAQCSNSARLLPPPPAILADTATSANGSGSIADELARLTQLRDSGTLTQAEFEAAKARVLAQPNQ
jgi:hypothetical protein